MAAGMEDLSVGSLYFPFQTVPGSDMTLNRHAFRMKTEKKNASDLTDLSDSSQ